METVDNVDQTIKYLHTPDLKKKKNNNCLVVEPTAPPS